MSTPHSVSLQGAWDLAQKRAVRVIELEAENSRLEEQLEAAEESAERWKGWYEEAMLGSNPASSRPDFTADAREDAKFPAVAPDSASKTCDNCGADISVYQQHVCVSSPASRQDES